MIAATLFLTAASAAALPPPEVANEIVVIGRKLEKTWRGKLAKRDGRLACKTTRSTGDAAIDAIGCGAMLHCTTEVEARMDALAGDRSLPKRERHRRMEALLQTTIPCAEAYRGTAIARLAASRTQP